MEDPLKTQVDEKKEHPQERKPDRVAWKLVASAICGAAIMYGIQSPRFSTSCGVEPGDVYILTSASRTRSDPFTTNSSPWMVSVFVVGEVRGCYAKGITHWMEGDGSHQIGNNDQVWGCSSLKSSFTKIE